MQKTLKQKTISGMIWNGLERFGSSLFLFISNLVLARLLSPEDFGAIGMLMVFISLSQAIIDGGFGSALIQKKEPTQTDYSTIFFWNIALSTILYIALYLSSPAIARFYDMPSLIELLRVLGIVIVFNSLFLIQNNILKKSINFKKVAKINLLGIVIGTILGIIAAYCGYGVWSLVIKTISTAIIQCLFFWTTSKWRPQLIFCWSSFKSLFAFGGYMFLNTITNTLYAYLTPLIIGKIFSATTLGYFTQAKKLEDVPRNTISTVINNVTFPIFAECQNDKKKLKEISRKVIKSAALINFPIMMLLSVIGKPLILILFTDKWEAAIPMFQILCAIGVIYLMYEINFNIIAAIGKSKLLFHFRICQLVLSAILLVIGAQFGIYCLIILYVASAFLSYFVVVFLSGKLLNYGFVKQFKDIYIYFIISLISSLASNLILISNITDKYILNIIACSSVFGITYLGLIKLCQPADFSLLNFTKKNNTNFLKY